MNNTSRDASGSGYITTLLGRKCRFDKWEEAVYNPGVLKVPMSHAEAEKNMEVNLLEELLLTKL